MKRTKNILKKLSLGLIGLVLIIVLISIVTNQFGPARKTPKGTLVDIDGVRLHADVTGKSNNKPTLVIENGSGLPTEFFYWIDQQLKDHIRIVRYDRAGLGFSEECTTSRDPETIAHELRKLLEKLNINPPYVMMGHSIGGPYIRVFAELFPQDVVGLFLIDATHPDHVIQYDAPTENSFIFKAHIWSIGAQAILADLGVLHLYDNLFGAPFYGEGLPDEVNARIKDLLRDGKSFRTFKKEQIEYYNTIKRSGELEDYGRLPIRVFEAVSKNYDATKRHIFIGPHKAFKDLSSNGKQIDIVSNHVTIYTKEENAKLISDEVLNLLNELGY